jgi:bifunctional UDP-N-acetylglucosamine pyrophosphorylase / glucosamine-1-phosphate N-acetyltransferase
MQTSNLIATVLAGGLGSRMSKTFPKVLYKVNNKIMIIQIIKKISKLSPYQIIIIVGKYHQEIKNCIDEHIKDTSIITYVFQPEPLGTGHAIACTLPILPSNRPNLIINGDTPLIKSKTLATIVSSFNARDQLLVTGINIDNPINYGRIIKNQQTEIIEELSCTDEQKKVKLINTGIYVANTDFLKTAIPQIKNGNSKGEYYLTDMLLFSEHTNLYILENSQVGEIVNINTLEDLNKITICASTHMKEAFL